MQPLIIDGSRGEGGGQIVRTTLSLAAVTGRPVIVEHVRAGRTKSGLLRQHLTALRAIAAICDAEVEGASLGSSRIRLVPSAVKAGAYRFDIGSAGSAGLVLQTVIWPLLFASGPSQIVLEGGTHNPTSPPFDYLARTFVPILERMGAQVRLRLERHGFYPAGGGRYVVEIEPTSLAPFELLAARPVRAIEARAIVARLPRHVGEREVAVVRQRLAEAAPAFEARVEEVESPGPGNALVVHVLREAITETFSAFGERGLPAEKVAARACEEAEAYLGAKVPVGEHLADQLILAAALAGRSAFRTTPLTRHSTTHVEVIDRLLGRRPIIAEDDGAVVVRYA